MTFQIKLFYFMWIFGMFMIVYSWFAIKDITIGLLSVIMTMVGIMGGKVFEK